jgi:hypothetical protein
MVAGCRLDPARPPASGNTVRSEHIEYRTSGRWFHNTALQGGGENNFQLVEIGDLGANFA